MTTSNKLPPEGWSEERVAQAEELLDRVDKLANKARQGKQNVDAARGALFGAKEGETREKTIWRGIVWFANADLHNDPRAYDIFREFLNYLLDGPDGGDFPTSIESVEFADIAEIKRKYQKDREAAFRYCVDTGQGFLRRLLLWLSEPTKHPELAKECLKGLCTAGSAVLWEVGANEFSEDLPLFFWKRLTDYGLLMSPICNFILRRVERFHEGALELQDAIPVRVCEREGCGKFLVPARTDRKKFCSSKCLQLSHPPRSGEENRDYMRVYRLEQEPPSVLRKKLASAKWRTRLTEIAKAWPELSERVQDLKRRAKV